ncbi:LysM peptidoglycan-binding domain-containing protein [Actibacterium sp. MT2.3-13A]|uniref:LysM peptidoglycan-binding domain-containing protein n=1 Tax=Actibacterium sp. MT2.3-13A TaxID=2828332 RepID=UPI001BA6574D|nr:LysM peptidoglycan-binding domain-containing protein [Actibacterium sp. MT2.3-13A]
MPSLRPLLTATALVALAGCQTTGFDFDLRNNEADTTAAVIRQTAPRPEPDDRGVISYPNYQVVVARRGDTVAALAARVGISAEALSAHNGIAPDVELRPGEILALPGRVAEPSPQTGSPTTGPIRSAEQIDITTIAGDAIERAGPQTTVTPRSGGPKLALGEEPVKHKVERGETAYSIARLYNVSVRALADWNGLGTDLGVREGQYLLIPVAASAPPPAPRPATATTAPGQGTPTPTPPSAAKPLPRDSAPAAEVLESSTPPSPALAEDKTSQARMALPAKGKIIRGYEKKKNDGIDIAAAAGSEVVAADSGTVAAITRDTDQVPILVLRHDDNLLTVYANIEGITVKKGDRVARGQQVAVVRAGDPAFLHFEVRRGFESVDPMPFLN